MSLFTIDPDKCQRDYICADECPMGLFLRSGQGDPPVEAEEAEELCLDCGHCLAVCPHQAVSLRGRSAAGLPLVESFPKVRPEQMEGLVKSRRSIRAYLKKRVPRATLNRLIDLARYAPSGHNTQPVHFLVVEKAEQVQALAALVMGWVRQTIERQPGLAGQLHLDKVVERWESGYDRILRHAPHLIAAHGPRDLRTAQAACLIALTYLELAAPTFGLGTCWAGYFMAAAAAYAPLQEALALPQGHQCFAALMIGWPKHGYVRVPERKPARVEWR